MKIKSLFDNSISESVKYSYCHIGTNIAYPPDNLKETEELRIYTKENGNLFHRKEVSWLNTTLLKEGVDIEIKYDETAFVDHISLCQSPDSEIASVEVFTCEQGKFRKIGVYKPETGKTISSEQFIVPVGYHCNNLILRLNADCLPIGIKQLDIFALWDIENTIYPTPNLIEYKPGILKFAGLKTVKAVNEDEKFAAKYFCDKLEKLTGIKPEITQICGDLSFTVATIHEKDSFTIDINEDVAKIQGKNRISLLYAAEVLLQLFTNEGIKCCYIEDEAFMDFRGVHLPIPNKADVTFLKEVVENILVPMRYNTVIFEIASKMRYDNFPEINEAWTHCIDMYEKGEWPMPAHYSFLGRDIWEKDELRELLDYFEGFGFEIIPEVQCYSHSQYLTTAYPDMAEKIDVTDDIDLNVADATTHRFYYPTMCPLHEDYYKLMFGIIDEVIEVFKPKRFVHMGHDEVYDVGACSKCRQVPRDELFATEVNTLHDYIKTKKLNMVIWSDMLQNMPYSTPGAINKVSKDILMMDFVWYFHLDEDIEVNLLNNGFKVVMGNMYTSHYPRFEVRSHRDGLIGAQVSTWTSNDEKKFAQAGKAYELLFAAEAMWNSNYESIFRLSINEVIKPMIIKIRQHIGGLIFDGVEKTVDVGGNASDIPYDIRGIVPYNNALSISFYNPIEELKIDEYARQLTFVHATSSVVNKIPFRGALKIAEYVLVYEDGTEYTEDIEYGTNIYKYRSVYGDILKSPLHRHVGYAGTYMMIPECGKTYNGEDYTIGAYSIKNPYSEKRISKIKFKHEQNVGAGVIVFGLKVKK